MEVSSSAEEEEKKVEKSLTSNEIRKMCKIWETLQSFVENHHPNKAVAVWMMNLLNNNAVSHFHEVLNRKRKQVSLDRLLVKVAQKEKDSIEPVDSSDFLCDSESHLHNNLPLSRLPHTSHEGFQR